MRIFEGFNEGTTDGGFEKYCKALLEQMNFTCELTASSGDDGIDIIAVKDNTYYGIQCKNYEDDSNVGNDVILKTIGGIKAYSLNKAMVLTTTNFTAKAKEVAKKCDVELWNWSYISELAKDYNIVNTENDLEEWDIDSVLFDWNKDVYSKMEEYLEKDNKAMVVIGTGLGKTTTAVEYYKSRNGKALVIANTKAILDSWKKIPNTDTITYQSFTEQYKDLDYSKYTVVICDEVHHAGAITWGAGIQYLINNGIKVIGLTATKNRMDGVDVADKLFGNNICKGLTVLEGINQGILYPFSYVGAYYNAEQVCKEIKEKYGEKLTKQLVGKLDTALNNTPCVKDILTSKMPDGKRKGIIFVEDITSMQEGISLLKNAFPDVVCKEFHSKLPSKEQKEISKWFENTEAGFICAVDKVSEGIHYNNVNTLVMLRRTKSSNVFEQQLGRVITLVKKENPNAIVFDLVNNSKTIQEFKIKIKQTRSHNIPSIESIRYINTDITFNNYSDTSKQIIIDDYVSDIENVLEEIHKNYDTKDWTKDEDNLIRLLYTKDDNRLYEKLLYRSKGAIQQRAAYLGISYLHKWIEEEDKLLKKYYPIEKIEDVLKRLPTLKKTEIYNRAKKLNIKGLPKQWTKEEDTILIKYYKKYGYDGVKNFLHRSSKACYTRAIKLGIMNKVYKWTEEEDNILITYFNNDNIDMQEKLPNHSLSAINNRANELGLINHSRTTWTEEEIEILIKNYSKLGRRVYTLLPNKNEKSCLNKANALGLLMSKEVKNKVPTAWTEEEDQIIKKYYPYEGENVSLRLVNRTPVNCRQRASKLNIKYQYKAGSKRVLCVETNTVYNSLVEAAKSINKNLTGPITACCKYKIDTAYGYHWKYIED